MHPFSSQQVPEKRHMDGILFNVPKYKRCAQFTKFAENEEENRQCAR